MVRKVIPNFLMSTGLSLTIERLWTANENSYTLTTITDKYRKSFVPKSSSHHPPFAYLKTENYLPQYITHHTVLLAIYIATHQSCTVYTYKPAAWYTVYYPVLRSRPVLAAPAPGSGTDRLPAAPAPAPTGGSGSGSLHKNSS